MFYPPYRSPMLPYSPASGSRAPLRSMTRIHLGHALGGASPLSEQLIQNLEGPCLPTKWSIGPCGQIGGAVRSSFYCMADNRWHVSYVGRTEESLSNNL